MKQDRRLDSITVTEQGEGITYLTEENLLLLKRMFKNKKSYSYYMRALWIIRNLASNSCEINTSEGVYYDKHHELFPVLKITNELIGALNRDNIHISFSGNEINCLIDGEIFNVYQLD